MIHAFAQRAVFASIDSTNAEAARRAANRDYGPIWLRAEHQSAGRGRRGRSWLSAPGNLFLTYLGQSLRPPAEIALLGFAAGLALSESFETWLEPGRARLKWPNDLLLDGKKAAGILLESGAALGGGHWFALGLGINLAAAPEGLDRESAALGEILANAPSQESVMAALIPRLSHWAQRLEQEGFGPLRQAWLARAHGLGGPITIDLGQERVHGIFEDLSLSGALCLRNGANAELVTVSAGDVFFPGPDHDPIDPNNIDR